MKNYLSLLLKNDSYLFIENFGSRGKLVTSKNSVDNNFLPLGLSDGAKTKRSIKKDEFIKIDDVEINWNQVVLQARKYQINIINQKN